MCTPCTFCHYTTTVNVIVCNHIFQLTFIDLDSFEKDINKTAVKWAPKKCHVPLYMWCVFLWDTTKLRRCLDKDSILKIDFCIYSYLQVHLPWYRNSSMSNIIYMWRTQNTYMYKQLEPLRHTFSSTRYPSLQYGVSSLPDAVAHVHDLWSQSPVLYNLCTRM